jgi:hypothetical protein
MTERARGGLIWLAGEVPVAGQSLGDTRSATATGARVARCGVIGRKAFRVSGMPKGDMAVADSMATMMQAARESGKLR